MSMWAKLLEIYQNLPQPETANTPSSDAENALQEIQAIVNASQDKAEALENATEQANNDYQTYLEYDNTLANYTVDGENVSLRLFSIINQLNSKESILNSLTNPSSGGYSSQDSIAIVEVKQYDRFYNNVTRWQPKTNIVTTLYTGLSINHDGHDFNANDTHFDFSFGTTGSGHSERHFDIYIHGSIIVSSSPKQLPGETTINEVEEFQAELFRSHSKDIAEILSYIELLSKYYLTELRDFEANLMDASLQTQIENELNPNYIDLDGNKSLQGQIDSVESKNVEQDIILDYLQELYTNLTSTKPDKNGMLNGDRIYPKQFYQLKDTTQVLGLNENLSLLRNLINMRKSEIEGLTQEASLIQSSLEAKVDESELGTITDFESGFMNGLTGTNSGS